MVPTANPTSDPTTDKPPRPRRWIPHSLLLFLGLLGILAATGVLSAWLPYRWEQQAIHEIQLIGGYVTSEDDAAPDWLRQIVGWELIEDVKVFNRADSVLLNNRSLTDAELQHVGVLKKLKYLSLSDTAVTNAGLVHLERLSSLEQLDLDDTQISDAGLVHLGGLKNLVTLTLDDTPITDAGLVRLTGLKNLATLGLKGTQVTDTGIESFYRTLPTCQISR